MQNQVAAGLVCAALVATMGWTPAAAQDSAAAPAPASNAATSPGRYRLVSVAGKALPTTIETGLVCREEVTAGSLTLRPEGTWLLETTKREVCGPRTETESDTDDGRYTTEGQTVRFLDDHGNPDMDNHRDGDLDLDDLTTGTLGADGSLTATLDDGSTTLVFRR